jgi:hypothetical protein
MRDTVTKIVVEVAQADNPSFDDDMMVIVLEVDVPDREAARALLLRAEADERCIAHVGQAIERGEVWISIEDGTIEDPSPCFHHADAVDALEMYFGISPAVSKKSISKNYVDNHYRQIMAQRAREAKEGDDAAREK